MTEREIPYKIYEFYRNNPEETDREAYLYEVYGDVKKRSPYKRRYPDRRKLSQRFLYPLE